MGFVSEADCDEVLEECVELVDVAGRVGRKMTRPLDGLSEGGIRSAIAVDVPPASRFENDQRIRRRVLTGQPTSDGLDFVGNVGGIDVA